MTDVPASAVPALASMFRFQWVEAQSCFVLLYPEGMVKLSQSAGEILKRVDGEATVDAIVADLEQAFAGADLRNDVMNFLSQAKDNGWISY